MTRVLVVGGGGGIGRSVVARLEAAGQEVVVLDRSDGVDAADPEAVEGFLVPHRPLDQLVHVAGTVGAGGIEEHDLADWHRVLDDNLTSAFVVCRAVVDDLRASATGAVVLTSSVNGRTGGNRLSGPAYGVAKAGVIGLVRHLAGDLAADGVRVNAVAPGPVATAMVRRLSPEQLADLLDTVPLHRVAEPDEVAAAIAYLLSDAAASVTGVVLDINGGMVMS